MKIGMTQGWVTGTVPPLSHLKVHQTIPYHRAISKNQYNYLQGNSSRCEQACTVHVLTTGSGIMRWEVWNNRWGLSHSHTEQALSLMRIPGPPSWHLFSLDFISWGTGHLCADLVQMLTFPFLLHSRKAAQPSKSQSRLKTQMLD